MGVQALYQISLIAAFAAGMVALFAPCCISYLLPAYFANIFKERKRILFMTVVYSLGIFVVMLPIVLGAKALSLLFFKLHDQAYVVGGIFMLFLSFISLLGLKLPMPKIVMKQKQNGGDATSTFSLGVISGITSACCAPVLIGVVTLSALSPTVIQSLGVGAAYVLGMVTPLYLASVFIKKRNILEKPVLRKKITVLSFGNKSYPIFVSNIIASAIFFITGSLTLILSSAGMLGMPTTDSSIVKSIADTSNKVTEATQAVPGIDIIFVFIGLYLLYKFIKSAREENEK